MVWYTTASWIIAGLLIGSYGAVRLFYFFKERKEEKVEIPENAPRVRNFWSKMTGFAEGFELDVVHGKDGRMICTYAVSDVDTTKENKLKTVKIVIDKGLRIVYPKGDLSPNRNIVEYFPPSVTELPDSVAKSERGEITMNYITKTVEKNFSNKYLEQANDNKKELLMRKPLGEISAEDVELERSFIKVLLGLNNDNQKEVKASKGLT